MIREFAQRIMDAETRCGAGYREASPDRVNSRDGYRRREREHRARDHRTGDPQSCAMARTSRGSSSTSAAVLAEQNDKCTERQRYM